MSVRPAQMIYQKTHIKPNPNLKEASTTTLVLISPPPPQTPSFSVS